MLSCGSKLNRDQLIEALRCALRRGVPSWLRSAFVGCIEEVERATDEQYDAEALAARAETLLAAVRATDVRPASSQKSKGGP